ncbi:MAG: tetratricopeptide repeat protein [Desulfuromonadia bacterium]
MQHQRIFRRRVTSLIIGGIFLSAIIASFTFGSLSHPRFNRYEATVNDRGTHFLFKLSSTPQVSLTRLPDRRIRLVLKECDPGFIGSITRYADPRVRQVSFATRMNDIVLTFTLADPETGVRVHGEEGTGVISLDIGPGYRDIPSAGVIPSREAIKIGVERLIREFDPPLESGIPFTPVERTEVYDLLSPSDAKTMKEGEAFLYKGLAADAEQLFTSITHDNPKIRALILTRRGESRYLLRKFREALDDFMAAEKVYPDIITLNPTAFFAYGDSIARMGDTEKGRMMLGSLIASNAEKPYAQILLVRLGDILLRGGREREATAIYQNVLTYFPGSPAAHQARMKLADRRFLSVDSTGYRTLLSEYREIRERGGDFALREHAAFREVLLSSLYATAEEAAAHLAEFLSRYPRSAYLPIAESIQSDIVTELMTELISKGDHEGVARAAETYRDHLAKALQQGGVVRGIEAAYGHLSRIRGRLTLFSFFAERRWGGENAPRIQHRVIDDAVALGEERIAEEAALAYLERFPKERDGAGVREVLGEIRFFQGKPAEVARILSPFGEGRPPLAPALPQTLYFLGRSYLAIGEPRKAVAVLERYLAGSHPSSSPLAREASYDLSRGYEMIGEPRKGEGVISRAGKDLPPEMGDRFRYRAALLKMKGGKRDEGERILREIAEKGSDPVWKSAALQQLVSAELSAEIREAKRILSKK